MKKQLLIKTALLLVALFGGASASWAEDNPINIPQALGTYIDLGTRTDGGETTKADGVDVKGCSVDYDNGKLVGTSYTIGSSSGTANDTYVKLAIHAEAGNYIFSFKSGAKDASTVALSLTNSSSEEVWSKSGISILDTDDWGLTTSHDFIIGNLAEGDYIMTLMVTAKTGTYAGNFGNFCFHKSTQYADNWNNMADVNFADAFFSGITLNGTYLTNIDASDYVEYYSYVPNTACYNLYCGIGYSTAGTDNFTITITDVATSTAEVDAVNYTVVSSHLYQMASKIDEGWKKIRLAFPSQPASGSCRVEHVKYSAFDQLPLMGAGGVNTYLALNGGTYGRTASAKYSHDPAYESANDNIGYNGDGGYAEFYVGNMNETAYYDFHIGTSRYQEATFTLTITDVATSTVEVNQSGLVVPSGQSYTDQTYKLINAITPGLKKIRIETASESTSYAFNYNKVTFYKRSLNEGYDYTAVAATGVDVVLTRTITADKWSTIVLPFAMTSEQITTTFGEGTHVAQLTGYDSGNEILLFTTATSMTANEPYLIKVANAFSSATISGVNILEGTPSKTTISGVDFIGSYEATTDIPYSDGSNSYYFIYNNALYQTAESGTHDTMKGTRAYFKVPGTTAARQLSFSIDDETTGIHDAVKREDEKGSGVYDLQGRRVAQPTKGLYILNGKKVVIK